MAEGLTGQHSPGLWGAPPWESRGPHGPATGFKHCGSSVPGKQAQHNEALQGRQQVSRDLDSAHLTESIPDVTGTATQLTVSNPSSPLSGGPPQAHQLQSRASILDIDRVKTRDGKGCSKRHV